MTKNLQKRSKSGVFTTTIERLGAGGDGIGYAPDGRVVFVPWSAPGDRLQVRPVKARSKFIHAETVELIEPGAGRTDPLCPVFGVCGGCSWQHLNYDVQLEAKSSIVEDAFSRIAKIKIPRDFKMHKSEEPYGYRSRARVLVDDKRSGFRKLRSHAICNTRRCPVLVPDLDEIFSSLAESSEGRAGEWEIAVGDNGDTTSVLLPADDDNQSIGIRAGGKEIRVSSGVFFQAHRFLRNKLRDSLGGIVDFGERALELYAGAGFFTGELARRFSRVLAIEVNSVAVSDLTLNCGSLSEVEILQTSVEAALQGGSLLGFDPQVTVLDPPRQGLSSEVIDGLMNLAPPRVAYVSCDPATLARDAGLMVDAGYDLTFLEAYDFFPQTPHVECLALMEKSNS